MRRVACIQTQATADKVANLDRAERGIREAASAGADLLVLGEKWNSIGEAETIRAGAEPADGPSLTRIRELASELDVSIIAGSIALDVGDGVITNTSFAITRAGEIAGSYSKLHMFDVEVDGVTYLESAATRPGGDLSVVDLDGIKVGLSICYDLRFPEVFRALAAAGAELISLPAAFTVPTGMAHWEVLVRARAIENQCYVAACGLWGEHEADKRSYGHSMLVDPWGVVLAEAPDGDAVIVGDVDPARLADVRARLPALSHRRDDVYGPPATVR